MNKYNNGLLKSGLFVQSELDILYELLVIECIEAATSASVRPKGKERLLLIIGLIEKTA